VKRFTILLVVALGAGLMAQPAAAGKWASYLRAYNYTDLLATGDTVWCATLEAGLLRFDATRATYQTLTREPGGLASNQLTALALDRAGRLWVGTQGAGVSLLAPDRKTWGLVNRFDGLPTDSITVLEAHGDSVFVGTTGGVALWNGSGISGAIPDGVNPSPFASNVINGLAQLGDTLWVATGLGIYRTRLSDPSLTWTTVNLGLYVPSPADLPLTQALASDGHQVFTMVNDTPYRLIAPDEWQRAGNSDALGGVARLEGGNGVITVSALNGIYRWDDAAPPGGPGLPPGDWQLIQGGGPYASSLDPDSTRWVYTVASDPVGGVTYAANLDGVHVLTPGCIACPVSFPPGPPGNTVINLALQSVSTGSKVYINTFQEGVGRFDGTSWTNWFPVPCTRCDTTFFTPIYTYALQVDNAGHKWVACWNGPMEEFDDSVSPPNFTHHREAYFSEVIPAPIRHYFGWSSAIDPDGGHWFGLETNSFTDPPTPLGLDYYGPSGAFVRNFRPENTNPGAPMAGSQIRGLAVDHAGRMWVGYFGNGVQYFDWPLPASGVPDFLAVDGTGGLVVQSIRVFGDSIWVLTTRDLRLYDARTARLGSNALFTPPAATAQNAVRPLEVGPDGSVWLGTENGLRIYHPGGAVEDFSTDNSPLATDLVLAIAVDPKTGAAWIGTSGGLNYYDPYYVPSALPAAASLTVKLYPNPMALSGIGTPIRLTGNGGTYDGGVYDLGGRVVRHFTAVRDGEVFWNGADDHGAIVRPGVYFVRVMSQGRTATARIALVR
jgi:hypothetical protein